jgi:hypothetical protein
LPYFTAALNIDPKAEKAIVWFQLVTVKFTKQSKGEVIIVLGSINGSNIQINDGK